MGILVRIVGVFWILYSVRPLIRSLRHLLSGGLAGGFGFSDLLFLFLFAGGIGLLFLKDWGRWLVLLSCSTLLLLAAGPSLIRLQFPPFIVRPLVFYGLFIVLLNLRPIRSAVHR